MNFAPQKSKTVGRTTSFAASSGVFPSRFRLDFDLPEDPLYFQEVVNSLRNSATLALCFHHFVDSFAKNTGGGVSRIHPLTFHVSMAFGEGHVAVPGPKWDT
jgi:hypothetical protein